MDRKMAVDLAGLSVLLLGKPDAVTTLLENALRDSRADVSHADAPNISADTPVPDRLLVTHPSLLEESARLTGLTEELGRRMAKGKGGRIVHLLSAAAALPIRRNPQESATMAAAVASARTLAMTLGPNVLVNAVVAGAIVDNDRAFVSGGAHMLTHVPSGEPGAIVDVVNAAFFLCDPANSYLTGQMLVVDGGWAAGYGRDF